MKYVVSLLAFLAVVWLLWSGHTTPWLLSLGLVSAFLVLGLSRRMTLTDHEGVPVELLPRALIYLPWLLGEIVKSNLDVARRILDPRLPISPRIIRVRAGQRRDVARVLYANSITLTPGTVSIETQGETITVHALTREAAKELEGGAMNARVKRVEGAS